MEVRTNDSITATVTINRNRMAWAAVLRMLGSSWSKVSLAKFLYHRPRTATSSGRRDIRPSCGMFQEGRSLHNDHCWAVAPPGGDHGADAVEGPGRYFFCFVSHSAWRFCTSLVVRTSFRVAMA